MKHTQLTETITADRTLLAEESGLCVVVGAVDLTVTLPAAADGIWFDVVVETLSATTGAIVDGNGAETINGAATLTNTAATDAVGDGMHLVSDGTEWFANVQGTWA